MIKHSLILSLSILFTPLSYCMAPNPQQATAVDIQLIEAAKIGDVATMQDLIVNQGANVNATYHSAECTKCIGGLDVSGDVCATVTRYSSPLCWAIINGHTQAVKLLLSHSVTVQSWNQPCILAIDFGWLDIARLFLDRIKTGVGNIIKNSKLIQHLPNQQAIKILEALYNISPASASREIEQKLENNIGLVLTFTAINLPAKISKSCTETTLLLVEFIVAHGISLPACYNNQYSVINARKNQTELNQAVANNDLLAVIALLHRGVYCNKIATAFINQKLFDFIRAENTTALIDLIKRGFGLYARDAQGNTPLHVAIDNRSNKVASLLIYLLHKVQLLDKCLLIKNNAGHTPFELALKHHATNPLLTALCFGTSLPESTASNASTDTNGSAGWYPIS